MRRRGVEVKVCVRRAEVTLRDLSGGINTKQLLRSGTEEINSGRYKVTVVIPPDPRYRGGCVPRPNKVTALDADARRFTSNRSVSTRTERLGVFRASGRNLRLRS